MKWECDLLYYIWYLSKKYIINLPGIRLTIGDQWQIALECKNRKNIFSSEETLEQKNTRITLKKITSFLSFPSKLNCAQFYFKIVRTQVS